MIEYKQIHRFENMPFEDYLNLEGYSHSFCKYERSGFVEVKEITKKMELGSLVDSILTQGRADIRHELYKPAKAIAEQIGMFLGSVLPMLKGQVSYSGDMEHNGFIMRTTGRLDFEIPKRTVIDIKITEAPDIAKLVDYMGYGNQLWNYTKLSGSSKAYILAYNTKIKKCLPLFPIDVNKENEWWEEKILKFGKVLS